MTRHKRPAITGVAAWSTLVLLAVAAQGQPQTMPTTQRITNERPSVESITEVLQRVHGFLDKAHATRVIDRNTRSEITNLAEPAADAILDAGEQNSFEVVSYPSGVTYSGMLLASEVTGDPRYAKFVSRRLQFLHDVLPYFRAQAEKFGADRNSLRKIIRTESLDDSGSMCAGLIKARLAGAGPDLSPVIHHYVDYVHARQFRISDGTLARRRPQVESVWADDMYMSIPALAQAGKMTGETRYYDDAANQTLLFARHLFNWDKGIYTHGRNLNQPENPEFYWGRANGWAIMATVEVLDMLPEDHPRRAELLALLRAHIKGLAPLQSGTGLWHQMLDKTDSYLETSATAMFVYGIAKAINRGWISPVGYGPVAQAGWNGLTTQVNEKGMVEGTCVGTTFASDNIYYYTRRTSPYAPHGYGPVLLAGAEMIRLMQNPTFEIKVTNGAAHYVPRQ